MRLAVLTLLPILCFTAPLLSQKALEPVEVARLGTFAEAPVFDAEGNLYVSEPFDGSVSKITPEGEVSVWADLDGANGHKILSDGTHLVCERVRKLIVRLDADGNIIGEAAADCGGKPLRAPNDLVLDQQGGFYFTDPGNEEDRIGRIGYVDASGTSHLVAEISGYPNGIALGPNDKLLYVADFANNKILAYPIHAPAEVGQMELFAELPELEKNGGPDGILCDEAGNLMVAHLGSGKVRVLNPQAELTHSLTAGQYWVSNLVFGGPEGRTLYTTGAPKREKGEIGIVYKMYLSEATATSKE